VIITIYGHMCYIRAVDVCMWLGGGVGPRAPLSLVPLWFLSCVRQGLIAGSMPCCSLCVLGVCQGHVELAWDSERHVPALIYYK